MRHIKVGYGLSPVTVIKYLKKYEEDFKAGRL